MSFIPGVESFTLRLPNRSRVRMKQFLPLLLLLAPMLRSDGAPVDYLREVKPILAENCYRCHGSQQQKHGLRLDTAALALKGGETGPAFQPGQSAASLLIQSVKGAHPDISRMPYKKPPLAEAQIGVLARWIDQGAKAPADEPPETAKHWSFLAPARPPIPQIAHRPSPIAHPIDAFIRARLDRDQLQPAPEADRVTLIRRLSLDLLGLPPTPAEVDAFLADARPGAYERLVDRLLASPHYGERWGRHWLDGARYADSNGYSIDAPRAIWKYRDWVVAALNRDLPFDQFVTWQLAGDLVDTNHLPPLTTPLEPRIATGFHRNTQINQEGGIDPEQFRIEAVMDRVNTTATALLGVTLGCAQCHDHKFDPFTQQDYYRMFAFFNSTVEDGHGQGTPGGVLEIPGEFDGDEAILKEIGELEEDLDRYLNTQGDAQRHWEESLAPEAVAKLKPDARKALRTPFAQRDAKHKRAAYAAFRPDDPEFKPRQAKLVRLEKKEPKPITTLVMIENPKPRDSFIFIKGDFTRPGPPVTPGVPEVLQIADLKAQISDTKPDRLSLARWIVSTNNPLTARVLVNRVWQQYFGRGLVETENDFGTQGSPPSHPELLDWLACEFMQGGESAEVRGENGSDRAPLAWSLKRLHRLIVTSATYRQSSKARPDLALIDPNNKLLARQSRLRLDAEIVRDAGLRATGLLNAQIGGPPVFPPQPAGVMTLGQSKREWKPSPGPDRYRRALYTHFWRATPHPALSVFDAPDAFSACTRRVRSNTPLQALTLLNDEAFHEFAQALAARVLREAPPDDAARLDLAFRLCTARHPAPDERQRLEKLLALEMRPPGGDEPTPPNEAWTTLARVLLNLDETITRE